MIENERENMELMRVSVRATNVYLVTSLNLAYKR